MKVKKLKEKIIFTSYKKEHEFELLSLWRKSFNQAIGIEEDTREEAVTGHLEYLQSYNPDIIRVVLEEHKNKIIGFMAKEENTIKDLFIHVGYQRKGLGSIFINQAKKEEEFLSLQTLELNKGAQKFYEFHDFIIVRRGFTSFEANPWATKKEQLADISYEWRRS